MTTATIPARAAKWATYPSPQPDDKVGVVMGPDVDGAWLTVVAVDGNRLGFAYGVRCTACLGLVSPDDPANAYKRDDENRALHIRCAVTA